MDYPRILHKLLDEPWCITADAHDSIRFVLETHIRAGSSTFPSAHASASFNAASLALTPPRSSRSRVYTSGKLAVIPVMGIIGKGLSAMEQMCGGYSIDQLQADVAEAADDSGITRVLFDFNTPGGQISGIPETAKMIADLSRLKNTYGFTSQQSCSAGYWLMSQCNTIFSAPSAMTGSIGVYLARYDISKETLEAQGKTLTLIKAGDNKGAGLPGNPLTDAQKARLQEQVTMIYNDFTAAVTSRRPKVEKSSMQGDTFYGLEARKAGLVDSLAPNLAYLVQKLS